MTASTLNRNDDFDDEDDVGRRSVSSGQAPSSGSPEEVDDGQLERRCLRYLLGELDSAEAMQFEQELERSSDANQMLAEQAVLITALGDRKIRAAPTVSTDSAQGRQPWLAVAVALAACVALAIVAFRGQLEPDLRAGHASPLPIDAAELSASGDESLLIARAWASSHPVTSEGADEGSSDADSSWTMAETEFDATEDMPANQDSVLAWMVVAVASDADLQSTSEPETSSSGDTTDG